MVVVIVGELELGDELPVEDGVSVDGAFEVNVVVGEELVGVGGGVIGVVGSEVLGLLVVDDEGDVVVCATVG